MATGHWFQDPVDAKTHRCSSDLYAMRRSVQTVGLLYSLTPNSDQTHVRHLMKEISKLKPHSSRISCVIILTTAFVTVTMGTVGKAHWNPWSLCDGGMSLGNVQVVLEKVWDYPGLAVEQPSGAFVLPVI